MQWFFLSFAILAEVLGSSALKSSAGFTRMGPTLVAVAAFVIALYFLSLSLRVLPLGIAYAVWAGAGTALVAMTGVLIFRQSLDIAGYCGIGLIIAGVIVINVFSNTSVH